MALKHRDKITYVIAWGILGGGGLNGIGDKTENGSDPQQQGETSEELFAELDPFGRGFGRGQFVGTVTLHDFTRLL